MPPVPAARISAAPFYNRTRALAALVQHHHVDGVAATQLGWRERVIVIRDDAVTEGGFTVLVNPRIVIAFGDEELAFERCLSFEVPLGGLPARKKVRVMFDDVRGDPVDMIFEGRRARAICHEVRHLDGHTMLERVKGLARKRFLDECRREAKRLARGRA